MNAYRDQYAKLFHGGKGVKLVAISVDPVETLASWARDAEFPFTFLSDSGGVVGKRYGAFNSKYGLDDRSLYVIAPGGTVSHVQAPFQEIDPKAYEELAAAVNSAGMSRDKPAPPQRSP